MTSTSQVDVSERIGAYVRNFATSMIGVYSVGSSSGLFTPSGLANVVIGSKVSPMSVFRKNAFPASNTSSFFIAI